MSEDTAEAGATPAGEQPAGSDTTDEPPAATRAEAPQRPQYAPPAQEEADWRGWVLVGIVVVSVLVIPAMVLYIPYAQDTLDALGVGYRAAFLALPMIPAVLLGATAVWAALQTRRE